MCGEKEVSKTGLELWKRSSRIFERIIDGEFIGITSIINVMEVMHAVRSACEVRGIPWKPELEKAEDRFRRCESDIIFPDSSIMAESFIYFWNNHLDPYDAVSIAVAVRNNVDVFVTRDETLLKRAEDIIVIKTPEEILE